MIRPLLLAATLAACSRAAAPPPPATPRAAAPATSASAAQALARAEEEHEAREIMERAASVSRFPGTDEGAQAFALDLTRAAISNDREGLERAMSELRPDDARFELGLTFEGARSLRARVMPHVAADADALRARLATLREPLTVRVRSALGSELSDGRDRGLDPRMASVKQHLRPLVRFYRIDVTGAGGSGAVTLEPMAWLGARWTWLGPVLPPLAPVAPAPAAGR